MTDQFLTDSPEPQWTVCSCGHIAQSHDAYGACRPGPGHPCKKDCVKYDGRLVNRRSVEAALAVKIGRDRLPGRHALDSHEVYELKQAIRDLLPLAKIGEALEVGKCRVPMSDELRPEWHAEIERIRGPIKRAEELVS